MLFTLFCKRKYLKLTNHNVVIVVRLAGSIIVVYLGKSRQQVDAGKGQLVQSPNSK